MWTIGSLSRRYRHCLVTCSGMPSMHLRYIHPPGNATKSLKRQWRSSKQRSLRRLLMHVYEMPLEERIRRRQHIEARYTMICSMGEKTEPPPRKTPGKKGRYKRTKGRNLCPHHKLCVDSQKE
jgi:hypothetical protein